MKIFNFAATALLTTLVWAAQPTIRQSQWPKLSDLFASDNNRTVADQEKLSATERRQIAQIASHSIDNSCRKALGRESAVSIIRKLSIQRQRLRVKGPKSVIVQGGGDWEDSSDACFSDGHMNFDTWVVQPRPYHATVLLKTLAIFHLVLPSSQLGYFDVITGRTTGSGQMELVWWGFNGRRYTPNRCAELTYPTTEISERLAPAELNNAALISEHPCRQNNE